MIAGCTGVLVCWCGGVVESECQWNACQFTFGAWRLETGDWGLGFMAVANNPYVGLYVPPYLMYTSTST